MNAKIAKQYNVPLIVLNVVGAQDEMIFSGRSFILNNKGELLHEMAMGQEEIYILNSRGLTFAPMKKRAVESEMEELDALLRIYLRDYMRKSSNIDKPLYIGLSGGKDSTMVASVLVRHLGQSNVKGVIMPYRLGTYSSPKSVKLAEELGKLLEITTQVIPIDDEVDSLKEKLAVKDESLAHQNLQARVRATVLWTLANIHNGLVMNTTNFSEAATGYGTIGGDLLGLPLIASLPATTVVTYLRWLKTKGGLSGLSVEMIERTPTAELAPGQKDENELGRYDYIDPILESIRMNHGNMNLVVRQFLPMLKTNEESDKFFEKLRFLAKKLLVQSEFKRWYYFKTPQLMPFSWLRWKWPIANAHFDIDRYIALAKENAI